MKKSTITEQKDRDTRDALTEVLLADDRTLIAQALEAEVADLLLEYADQRDAQGRALLVRSGHHPEAEIQTGIEPVTI